MEKIKEKLTQIANNLICDKIDQELTNDLIENIDKLGMEKSNIKNISEANILASYILTLILNDILTSFQMDPDLIPVAISMFIDTYPDDFYFIVGCLALASNTNINFENIKGDNTEKNE